MIIPNSLILRDLPTELATKRLILRVPQAGDGPQMHDALMDGYEDLVKWVGLSPTPPTAEDVEIQSRLFHAKWYSREDMRFTIIEKDSKRIIGRFAYPMFISNYQVPLYGISYFIRASARNKGYGTEALRAVINFAFEFLGARKVQIMSDIANAPSIALCEKLFLMKECEQIGNWFPYPDGMLPTIRTYASFKKV